ncbi:MAG: hypothetical protein U5P41_05715 [Gammaproteobacteria bacterium]|nr:hypothetical protein [Gammaproteobacteria bacterium]
MKYQTLLLIAGALMLGACGKEEDDGAGGDEGQASDWDGAGGVAEMASSGRMQDSGLGYEYVVVDHSKDVPEFELRKSIGGKEALIEHYEENGWDTAELEKELKKLKKQLDKL